MEIGTHDHGHGGHNFPLSICLLFVAWFFHKLQELSADEIYTWVFRALSLVSVILVIYINWNKALEIFKSKKNKDDKPGEAPKDN